jgi:hypothetical protein
LSTDSRSIGEAYPIVKLIAFGGGITGIERALDRVRRQAEAFPLIDVVETFEPGDLDKEYFEKFGNLVESFKRGYGLWSWKSYLVNRELNKLRDGDILLYVDAGCEINPNGEKLFAEYLDYTSRKGLLFFSIGLQQRHWTKPNADLVKEEHYFRNQVASGVFFIKVCDDSRKFVKSWLDLCASDQGFLLKDPEPSQNFESPGFRDHRHDQSVLSKLVFEAGIEPLPDGTYLIPWSLAKRNPILSFRNRQTGFSWIRAAFLLPLPIFKLWQVITIAISPRLLFEKLREKVAKVLQRG